MCFFHCCIVEQVDKGKRDALRTTHGSHEQKVAKSLGVNLNDVHVFKCGGNWCIMYSSYCSHTLLKFDILSIVIKKLC